MNPLKTNEINLIKIELFYFVDYSYMVYGLAHR